MPQPRGLVATCDRKARAVRAEGDGGDNIIMAQPLEFLAARRVPEPRAVVATCGGELPAVGAEGDGINIISSAEVPAILIMELNVNQ